MPDEFKYDVIVNHSSKDKATVRELTMRLEAEELPVWFDECAIRLGKMIGGRLKALRILEVGPESPFLSPRAQRKVSNRNERRDASLCSA